MTGSRPVSSRRGRSLRSPQPSPAGECRARFVARARSPAPSGCSDASGATRDTRPARSAQREAATPVNIREPRVSATRACAGSATSRRARWRALSAGMPISVWIVSSCAHERERIVRRHVRLLPRRHRREIDIEFARVAGVAAPRASCTRTLSASRAFCRDKRKRASRGERASCRSCRLRAMRR